LFMVVVPSGDLFIPWSGQAQQGHRVFVLMCAVLVVPFHLLRSHALSCLNTVKFSYLFSN
jgi:hypothetical protein